MKEHQTPSNWINCKLGDVASVKNGFAFKSSSFTEAGIPVIRISDINSSAVSCKNAVKIQASGKYENFAIEYGDILIAMSGATTGKFGIYNEKNTAYQNQRVGNIRPLSGNLNKSFLFYYIFNAKRQIEKEAYGGAQPNISSSKIEQLEFWLPPLNEQKRIVAKIEELFSELDNGIASLKTARKQLKVYRQAILKHAFEGKLTAKWREENADKLETPEQLLTRIQQERDTQYQQKLEEWGNLFKEWEARGKNGKKPGKPRKQKIEIGGKKDFEGLVSLPSQWKWVLLNELSEHIVDGTHHTPAYTDVGVPFISAKDIKDFKVDFSNTRHIDMDQHQELIKRCKPRPNSVLLTKSGTIGRVALIEEDREFSLFESVSNIPLFKNVEGRYVAWSVYFQVDTHFGTKNQKGVAVRHLHLEDIRRLPVPLPSSEEQRVIVQQLEDIFSVINENEQIIDNELKRAESLRQSILKKAFSGQLIAQNPNDEPASELLRRIKTEKEQQKQTANN